MIPGGGLMEFYVHIARESKRKQTMSKNRNRFDNRRPYRYHPVKEKQYIQMPSKLVEVKTASGGKYWKVEKTNEKTIYE
jgi:hypothetical protein